MPLLTTPIKRRTLYVGLMALWLLGAANSQADEMPAILVLGDSLSAGYGIDESEGWVALLEQRLDAEGYSHRVVNASISGETTTGGLARLPKLLGTHEPDWVILELGGNDGLRGQPIKGLRNNLEQIVTMSRGQGAKVLLLGMQIPPNYGARYAGQFADLYPALAKELELPFVAFMLEDIATEPSYMQGDGIHPNASAQPLILKNVWPSIQAELQAPK